MGEYLKTDEVQQVILPWLVAGARRYLREGIVIPAKPAMAKREYQEEMHPVRGFVNECLVILDFDARDEMWPAADIYTCYCGWAKDVAGIEPVSNIVFGRQLKQAGIASIVVRIDPTRVQRMYRCKLNEQWTMQMRDPAFLKRAKDSKVVDLATRRRGDWKRNIGAFH